MEPRRTRKKTKQQQPDHTLGVALLSAGAAALGLGAAIAALMLRRRSALPAGHAAPDLAPKATVPPVTATPSNAALGMPALDAASRAPGHFRPDPTAVPTAEEREALRPATGPAPSLVADRGSVTA